MENQYKYTCTIELEGDINKAYNAYLDKYSYVKWNEGLLEVEITDENNYSLIFEFGTQKMKMDVKVLEKEEPNYAKMVYEVPGTWNLCVNKFKQVNGKIEWTMDVEFRFTEPQHLLIDSFIRRTYLGMYTFKNYFENS